MSSIRILHNPRCSKSRATKQILDDKSIDYEVVEYLNKAPDREELINILSMLEMEPRELMRKGETAYKENNLADNSLSRDELIDAMLANPILIERPIVIANGKAVIGRPPENVLDISLMSVKILILYHSVSGNTRAMAQHIARGIESVEDAEAVLRTVPDVSPEIEATAPPVPEEGAPYAELSDLTHCDGLILGSPTCFGNMSSALKHFIDQTSSQWFSGDLSGKPAAVFTSTSSLHGGQEMVLMSMMIPLMHHGMVITGIPYSVPELANTTSGGTPYGASHTSGPEGNNPLTDDEKAICKALGKRIAGIAVRLKGENGVIA